MGEVGTKHASVNRALKPPPCILTCFARYISNTSIIVGVRRRPLRVSVLLQLTTCRQVALSMPGQLIDHYTMKPPFYKQQNALVEIHSIGNGVMYRNGNVPHW